MPCTRSAQPNVELHPKLETILHIITSMSPRRYEGHKPFRGQWVCKISGRSGLLRTATGGRGGFATSQGRRLPRQEARRVRSGALDYSAISVNWGALLPLSL